MNLYISDLDGTLLNKDKIITSVTRNLLNNAIDKGVLFTVATARTPATVVDILDGVNIKIPAVMMNGVIIYDINEEKYINIENVDVNIVKEVLDIFDEFNTGSFIYTIKDNHIYVYYKEISNVQEKEFYDERCTKKQKTFKKVDSFFDAVKNQPVINFIIFDSYNNLKKVYDKIKNLDGLTVDFYKDIYGDEDNYYLEAYSSNASKANGIKYLSQYIGDVNTICFGDNLNDIPMFKIATESYAVENAAKELKDLATGVIESNNDDSVAKYIEKKENI